MKPWSQLSRSEQARVHANMLRCGGKSVNGVVGWYQNKRAQGAKVTGRKRPGRLSLPQVFPIPDEMPDPLTLEEIQDVLPT